MNYGLASQNWDIYWSDGSINLRFFQLMRNHQVVNHFPGMNVITNKKYLAHRIKQSIKESSNESEYDFVPKTWTLPTELYELNEFVKETKKKK